MPFFAEIEEEKNYLKIHLETQKTMDNQSNPERRKAATEGIIVTDLKSCHRAKLTKLAWY